MSFDSLNPLICGLLGYASIILCDLNNTSHNNDRMQSLYTVGGGLLGLAFFNAIVSGTAAGSSLPAVVRIPAGILAAAFFVLLVYVTFYTGGRIRWKKETTKSSAKRWWERELVTTGAFALCRHPAVWAMFFFSVLLIPAANLNPWYAATFSLCGALLAVYEDINVFPVLMRGYDSYKMTTPFLFPTKESFRRCFKGKKAK